jgi:hypothetical protein
VNIASASSEETVTSLKRRIAETEMRSTEAADWLVALIRIGSDIIGVERRLWDEMDALVTLRQKLRKLQLPYDV